jgi:prepilin-type processing-associated H-X9-DG protein
MLAHLLEQDCGVLLELLSKNHIYEYEFGSEYQNEEGFTHLVAIIGPGTAWREDGPVKLSDLPDGGKHTVMAVEVVDSGVHWAEPRDLTMDEALEGLKTGKGLRISSAHPGGINILFADGEVQTLPLKMPISVWQKILAGDAIDLDYIWDSYDESAPDMVDVSVNIPPYEPSKWPIILSIVVWLLSIVLLFHRAIKSRPRPVKIDVANDAVG